VKIGRLAHNNLGLPRRSHTRIRPRLRQQLFWIGAGADSPSPPPEFRVRNSARHLKSIIHSFLRQHRYAVISSLAANNTPESALIGIAVSANLEIIFDTLKSSRKYPISSPIRIALSSSAGKTNQLSNSRAGAHQPRGPDLAHDQKIYFETWPDGPAGLGPVSSTSSSAWLRYSDFNPSLAQISELTLPLSRP
jgi:hypothetical protein